MKFLNTFLVTCLGGISNNIVGTICNLVPTFRTVYFFAFIVKITAKCHDTDVALQQLNFAINMVGTNLDFRLCYLSARKKSPGKSLNIEIRDFA